MRGRAVQYMIDGVPQHGFGDSSRQLNSISPNSIERIEVVSGASGMLWCRCDRRYYQYHYKKR